MAPTTSTLLPPVTAPITLLLIEDDAGDAVLVQDLLEDAAAGFDVRWVRSVAEAEARLDETLVDCVVLDLGLPDAAGLDALARIRAARPDAAVLVLTGLADAARGMQAVAAGAQDYLVKGQVDGELLARSVRYAIERGRAEASARELRGAQLLAEENARLERGLLPRPLVVDPRLAVASGYRPGRRRALLGGDFFDVVEGPDGIVHALIGDVCGHGPDEAALGVCLRIAWRTLILGGRDVDDLLGTLQQVLVHERPEEEVFATVAMVSVAADRSRMTVRLAGHPPPILLADGRARSTELRADLPLGILDDGAWPGTDVALPPAPWTLVLYTDGLIEGRIADSPHRLGSERLVAMLEQHDGLEIDELIDDVERLAGGDLLDDVAVLALSALHAHP